MIPIIVVYKNPSDYLGKYVARLWYSDKPTEFVIVRDTLADVRSAIPAGFFIRVAPSVDDDPVIVEMWI
ncbi:hypothetical protein [Pelosinus propionicus]|uniref:Uncharacterized protein n=1 Tax=Pelosinus propionicus DSM 13327 TaxID=1123291 RepID=A0A1I4NFX0_9FIRM|nr:hypothetical protein [Pelosinus propionicus]SFM14286.1 hypothetical protein SAMN04490355_10462 [Pelosinus propionicus DSM 13327]